MRKTAYPHRIRKDRLHCYALPPDIASGEADTTISTVSLKQYANAAMYGLGLRDYLSGLEYEGWARIVEVCIDGSWIQLERLLPIGSDEWVEIYDLEEHERRQRERSVTQYGLFKGIGPVVTIIKRN